MPSSGMIMGGGFLALLTSIIYWVQKRRKTVDTSSLQNKVVVITGASSGLGEACAKAFYRSGARVILCARRERELERVKQMLKDHKLKDGCAQHDPVTVMLDVEDFGTISEKADHILSLYGTVDILVNNAGVSSRGRVLDTSLDVFAKLISVNYIGQVAIAKAILPHMLKQKSGHIVTISSIQGKIAIPYRAAYSASKHAVQAFCDSLRAEVRDDNIHVTVISPGYIKTNLSKNAVTGDGSRYGVTDSTTAQGMLPEKVAQEVLHVVCTRCKELLLAEFPHRLAVYLRNILPNLFFSIMNSRARKQRKDYVKSQ